MEEFLICAGIAIAVMLGLGILIKFIAWIDENTDINFGFILALLTAFAGITVIVFAIRREIKIMEIDKAEKLERRTISNRRIIERR